MASLLITTNYQNKHGFHFVNALLEKLCESINMILPETEDLCLELKTDVALMFKGTTELTAHCLWLYGGAGDKRFNIQLLKSVTACLRPLGIAADRIRINRVQLYEVLELNPPSTTPISASALHGSATTNNSKPTRKKNSKSAPGRQPRPIMASPGRADKSRDAFLGSLLESSDGLSADGSSSEFGLRELTQMT